MKAQIARFGLANVVGEIQPQGSVWPEKRPNPHWMRKRREKLATHKEARREGTVEVTES